MRQKWYESTFDPFDNILQPQQCLEQSCPLFTVDDFFIFFAFKV